MGKQIYWDFKQYSSSKTKFYKILIVALREKYIAIVVTFELTAQSKRLIIMMIEIKLQIYDNQWDTEKGYIKNTDQMHNN